MGGMRALRLVGLAILAALVWSVGAGELAARARTADPVLFLAATGILVLSAFAFLVRWQAILRGLGYRVPWRSAWDIVLLGLFSNLVTPGRLGDIPVRAYFLKSREGVPLRDGLATTSGDRYIDTLFLMLVGLASLWALSGAADIEMLRGEGMQRARAVISAGLLVLAAVPVLALARTAQVAAALRRVLPARLGHRIDALEEAVPRLRSTLATFLRGRTLAAMVALTPLQWLLYALSFHVYLLSFGPRPSPWLVVPAFFVSYLVGLASMVPGGIGTSDLGVVAILAAAGVDRSAALAASLAVKVVNMLYVGLLIQLIPERSRIGEAAEAARGGDDPPTPRRPGGA